MVLPGGFCRLIRAATLLLPLVGCVDVSTTITVNADGSGRIAERLLLAGPMAEMVVGLGETGGPIADPDEVRRRAAAMGDGVRVLAVRTLPESDGVGAVVEFAFDDVRLLRLDQNPLPGKTPAGAGADGEARRGPTMRFRFQPGPPAELTVLLEQAGAGGAAGGKMPAPTADAPASPASPSSTASDELAQQLKEMMKGLRMAIALAVEGVIVETNASHHEGNRVTLLELNFDELLQVDPSLAASLQPGADVAAMKEALEKVPGMKIELRPEVRIVFQPGLAQTVHRQQTRVAALVLSPSISSRGGTAP
jgi:hypothetical protein